MEVITQWDIWKENNVSLLLSIKLIEKIADPCNAKEHYQLFLIKKHKISKTIKNNYSGTKNIWKLKQSWCENGYYRSSRNFTQII